MNLTPEQRAALLQMPPEVAEMLLSGQSPVPDLGIQNSYRPAPDAGAPPFNPDFIEGIGTPPSGYRDGSLQMPGVHQVADNGAFTLPGINMPSQQDRDAELRKRLGLRPGDPIPRTDDEIAQFEAWERNRDSFLTEQHRIIIDDHDASYFYGEYDLGKASRLLGGREPTQAEKDAWEKAKRNPSLNEQDAILNELLRPNMPMSGLPFGVPRPPQVPGMQPPPQGVQVADAGMQDVYSRIDSNLKGADHKNRAVNLASAYKTMMGELDTYEADFKETGGVWRPGAERDGLEGRMRNIQLQMKELYNLGVLNGPDLMLMEQMLVSPTSFGNNVMDWTGIAPLEERIPANIEEVRKMMTTLVAPRLEMAGVDPSELLPKKNASEMSDEELLKSLGLN